MYRSYDIPFKITNGEIFISVEKAGDQYIYRREYQEDTAQKILAFKNARILVNPIEPLTQPEELTPYLLIILDKKLVIAPKESETVYLTFPVEIGVFLAYKKEFKRLDSFTQAKQKYTLYGNPRHGIICKYWESGVYSKSPRTDPFEEGVVALSISNNSTGWIEISQVVFNAYGMKLYYDDKTVAMKAKMKITGATIAETGFVDSPLSPEMKKSIEYYRTGKISIIDTTYIMEMGL